MQYKIVPLISLILDAIVGKLKKYLVKPKLDENKTDCTLKNDFIILWIFFFQTSSKGARLFFKEATYTFAKMESGSMYEYND